MTTPSESAHALAGDLVATPRLFRPLERFLHVETASGVVLLIMAVVALIWANSPAAESYEHLWHLPVQFQIGTFVFAESLHFVINDILMTVFFLVVGLEIRREIHEGALADMRLASLPLLAAAGGIIAPAAIYLSLNTDPQLRQGWAVPTATDIAFAVGVLALLGKRVPGALRVLLLALAIIDDIAAILIIAFFYSSGVQVEGFLIAAVGAALVYAFQQLGFRSAWPFVIPGAIVWWGVWHAQVHPTIAGVILGLMTPVKAAFERDSLVDMGHRLMTQFRQQMQRYQGDPHEMLGPLRRLSSIQREMMPPAIRVQMSLHPWVAFGIMPLFALANAGVSLEGVSLSSLIDNSVSLGVIAGLVIGKPLGVTIASLLATRLRIAEMPRDTNLAGLILVGCLAGIGFTMAIFIANLAFTDPDMLASAKLAILIGSALSAVIGLIIGWRFLPTPVNPRLAIDDEEQERLDRVAAGKTP